MLRTIEPVAILFDLSDSKSTELEDPNRSGELGKQCVHFFICNDSAC